MSALVGAALRAAAGAVRASRVRAGPVRELTRSLWHASRASPALLRAHAPPCACGCGAPAGRHALHTKGERELVEFLTEEIVAERKAQKLKSLPTELDGFQVKGDGAEVVLSKQTKEETINVTFNVNHTVDSEDNAETDPRTEKQEFAEMRSRPQFEVDLVRGGATLSFTCSFLQEQGPQEGEEYNDIFGIDEITMYQGEWNDKTYAVAGDVLDGYLYDLLMNVLEEKGISNEFVQKLSDFSTAYEHSAYINLLEGLSKFTIGK